MKNLWRLAAILPVVVTAACGGLKERTIEMPDMAASTTDVIDVRSVEVTDSNTVLNIHAKFHPGWWILIAEDTKIVANGVDYDVVSADSITLGKRFWMPESGEADFRLTFPAIPVETEMIDFIEGKGEVGGFRIFGIDISGRRSRAAEVAQSLPKQVRKAGEGDFDMTIERKAAETTLNFHVLDYRREYGNSLQMIQNTMGENARTCTVKLDSLGNGSWTGMLYGPTTVAACISDLYKSYPGMVMIDPGSETDIYIDPRVTTAAQMTARDSLFVRPKYGFDNGKYAALNSKSQETSKYILRPYDAAHPIASWNATADEYADSVLSKRSALLESLKRSELPAGVKKFVAAEIDAAALAAMTNARHVLGNSYYHTHQEARSVPQDSIQGIPGDEQLARVAEAIDLENPLLMLYADYVDALDTDWSRLKSSAQTDDMRKFRRLYHAAKNGKLTQAQIEEAEAMSDPYYADALKKRQHDAIEAMAELKKMVQPVPDVSADKLMEAIVAPHKGKVVLIDLWNTWCGPCRMALQHMEPIKSRELADEDMVWIYIADTSSDVTQYTEMLPEIKGLHYMLEGDQIAAIRKQFEVDGIPYYILVDRNGKAAGRPDLRDHNKMVKELKGMLNGEF